MFCCLDKRKSKSDSKSSRRRRLEKKKQKCCRRRRRRRRVVKKNRGRKLRERRRKQKLPRLRLLLLPMYLRRLMTQILIPIPLTTRPRIIVLLKMRRNALDWIISRSFASNVSTALKQRKRQQMQISSDVLSFVFLVTLIRVKQNFLIM